MDELNERYQRTFSRLKPSQAVRDRILQMAAPSPAPGRYLRRLSGIAAAAVLLLALLGCAVVGAVYGDSIQSWFSHYFEAVHGGPMSKGQAAVIDRLTQELNLSQTVDGVTVTVDSATVGDDAFFLLLRVEGLNFSKRWSYSFDQIEMNLSPDPVQPDSGGMGGYGFQYHGLDGDGAVLIMMDMGYVQAEEFVPDLSPLAVTLSLTGLIQSGGDLDAVLAQGTWEFSFTLDRSRIPEPVRLNDTTIFLYDSNLHTKVPVVLTNIQVTNTGIRFQYRTKERHIYLGDLSAVFLGNVEVGNGGGFGTVMEDGVTTACSYHWSIPVNLEDVTAIRIGGTDIPVP